VEEIIPAREKRRAAEAAEMAKAEDCPVGKVRITGTVLGLKVEESAYSYGYRREAVMTTKMLVRDDRGFKVYGTRPAIKGDRVAPFEGAEPQQTYIVLDKGDRVTFNATIERSEKDPKFGFFRRPSGAKALKSGSFYPPMGEK
jgi:hypothetical protein